MNPFARFPMRSGAFLLALAAFFTLTIGSIPFSLVWEGILDRLSGSSHAWNPLLDERLPRLIVILCTGSSLAVSGAVMQALFQNPLASPSVLGISSGGCLFVLLTYILQWNVHYPFSVPLAAFSGCILSLLLVYRLAKKKNTIHLPTLLLTGIAISTLFLAIQGAILYALRDHWQLIKMLTEWEAGSTYDRNWSHVHMQLPLTLVGLWGCWHYRQELNILALGEEEAANLGVDAPHVRWRLFLCAALLTGGAIAALGIVAFFGLLLPHLIRSQQGPDHKYLIPLCMLFGAAALALMDNFLRFYEIQALTIGNLSAIMGGGCFLFLLLGRPYARSPYAY